MPRIVERSRTIDWMLADPGLNQRRNPTGRLIMRSLPGSGDQIEQEFLIVPVEPPQTRNWFDVRRFALAARAEVARHVEEAVLASQQPIDSLRKPTETYSQFQMATQNGFEALVASGTDRTAVDVGVARIRQQRKQPSVSNLDGPPSELCGTMGGENVPPTLEPLRQ